MSDATDPRAWIERAEEDYAAVLSAVRRKRPLNLYRLLSCSTMRRESLKAILVLREVPFSKTHDLLLLNDLCTEAGVLLGLDIRRLNTLLDHAVKVRYPGDDPTTEEAREAQEIARQYAVSHVLFLDYDERR